jgi:hypothetical protein
MYFAATFFTSAHRYMHLASLPTSVDNFVPVHCSTLQPTVRRDQYAPFLLQRRGSELKWTQYGHLQAFYAYLSEPKWVGDVRGDDRSFCTHQDSAQECSCASGCPFLENIIVYREKNTLVVFLNLEYDLLLGINFESFKRTRHQDFQHLAPHTQLNVP